VTKYEETLRRIQGEDARYVPDMTIEELKAIREKNFKRRPKVEERPVLRDEHKCIWGDLK
jgi:hypothetical protein